MNFGFEGFVDCQLILSFIDSYNYIILSLNEDENNILKIHSNEFTNWIIRDRGQDQNIINHFQRYTNDKLNPLFNEQTRVINVDGALRNQTFYPEVTFSYLKGTERFDNIKISKAEESNFIWCVFYSLLEEAIETLNETDITNRSTNKFNHFLTFLN